MQPVLWLLLVTGAAAVNLKIGVITENGHINSSLIENAFTRRVNSNWRVLQGHTLSYVHVNVSWCDSQQAVRTVCSESALSGLIAVGSCSLMDEVSSLSKSLQLPLIALPTGLCDSARLLKDFVAVGSHSSDDMVNAASAVISSRSAVNEVAIFYDGKQSSAVMQHLQSSLTSVGVSSVTFQVDNTANASVTADLVSHLQRLVKKRMFNMIVLATPHNALSVLKYANESGVMKQHYFWLMLDTGLSKADVMRVTPANANVALLRGSVSTDCTSAVMDVFQECHMEWIRTLDARFVDAVESFAKSLNDSLLDGSFSLSNATCVPLQQWTHGSIVYNRLINMSNYDTHRGVVSYNISSRHFSSQGVQVVASYNEVRSSPTSFLQSAVFDPSSGAVTKLFHYKGIGHVFPNTFTGFKNETLVICTPESAPMTVIHETFPNKTVVMSGMTLDLLKYFSERMEFQFITKDSDDGNWGSPQAGVDYFTGCVGELQRGLVTMGAGPFTKTAIRDTVIDFATPLFEESNAIMLPRPPPASKLWNVYTPFTYGIWLLTLAFIFLSAFITWVLAYFSPFTAYNLKLDYAIADEVWLQEYFWSIVGSFLQQGQDFYPFAMSSRTVLAFWWLFTVVIYGAYTGDLTAHLTVTVTDYPIKTLDDLVSQSAIKPYVTVGTNLHTLFKEANSGIYKQIADMMVEHESDAYCPTYPPEPDQACLDDYTFLLSMATKNCTDLYMADEIFNTATVAFMIPEDAHFADMFNFHMQKLHESGAVRRLFKLYWSTDAPCSVGKSAEADAINLEGTGGCFIVTFSLYVMGLMVLLLELLWTKAMKKQPMDCIIY